MSWVSRARKQVRRTVNQATHQVERSAGQASDFYGRNKDAIITTGGAILGGVIGSVVPVIGTTAGAMLGASIASSARSGYVAHKQAGEAKDAAEEQQAMLDKYNSMNGGLADQLRRRRVQRGAGEAAAEYDTQLPTQGQDVAAEKMA